MVFMKGFSTLFRRTIMLDSKLNNIRIETITSKHYDDVIEHLRQSFFTDEPLNKAVNLTRPGQGHPLLELHSLSTLRDNVSLMAISDEGEIAGVALNGIIHSNRYMKQYKEKLNDIQDENFKKIFKLHYEQNLKINLFKQFDVDKIFDVRILSVDSKFRDKRLAKKLGEKTVQLALDQGFQVMKTDATGEFSQRIASSMGFTTKCEINYADYLDENGEQIFVVKPPHEKFKIMFRVLN